MGLHAHMLNTDWTVSSALDLSFVLVLLRLLKRDSLSYCSLSNQPEQCPAEFMPPILFQKFIYAPWISVSRKDD